MDLPTGSTKVTDLASDDMEGIMVMAPPAGC